MNIPDNKYFNILEYPNIRYTLAQTLCNATPLIGQINPFSKIAITFKPVMLF